MLSAHKRTNPFASPGAEDQEMTDVHASVGSATKRHRFHPEEMVQQQHTPLRKRVLQPNIPQHQHDEPLFTLKDLERARDEGRVQSSQKIRALITANEALRHALTETAAERDKLAGDCKVLKQGVLTLNNRSTQLTRELEQCASQLREECEKNRSLQSAIIAMHANWSMGGCRKR